MVMHPIFQGVMDDLRGTPDRLEGLQRVGRIMPMVMSDIASKAPSVVAEVAANMNDREPRYRAEDGMVVSAHTNRYQTPERARSALGYLIDDALTTRHAELLDTDLLMIGDLIRAIREAEGTDPTPPAAIAQAA